MARTPSSSVPRSVVLGYSTGSIGTGIYLTVPGVLLLYYLSEVLGVPPALAGLAVFLPRLWDVVTDPVMGWLSDRTRSVWGRRRPYLLIGAMLTAGSFVFLFNTPDFDDPGHSFIFVLIVYILSATAYTVFAVPYIAMPAEMSADADERASIMAWRMSFAMAGVLAGSAAAPALVGAFGGGRAGFAGMSLVLGSICAVTMLLSFFATSAAPVVRVHGADSAKGSPLLAGFRHRTFRILAVAYAVQLGGLGIFTAAAPFFVSSILERGEAALGTVFLCLLTGTMLSLFLWTRLGSAIGKVSAYGVATCLLLLALAALSAAEGPERWHYVLATTGTVGVAFGGLQVLPFAMLTDVIHLSRQRGDDVAGSLTGLWTAVEKAGLAAGPLLVGGMLSIGGFEPGAASQPETAKLAIRVALSAGPALLVVLSLPALWSIRRNFSGAALNAGPS